MLGMQNAPRVDTEFRATITRKYFPDAVTEGVTTDPLTDESLDYSELVEDIVGAPRHGYSKFHIGHQDPRSQPKHLPGNIRWQLKTSNDFQGTMDIRVARIAYRIDQFTRNRNPGLFEEAYLALIELGGEAAARVPSTPTGTAEQ
ncbi:MAG: hypothetical protein ACHQPI_08590 [Thermoanaerobaculia bacterium]